MAEKTCHSCGTTNTVEASYCTRCGLRFECDRTTQVLVTPVRQRDDALTLNVASVLRRHDVSAGAVILAALMKQGDIVAQSLDSPDRGTRLQKKMKVAV